MRTTGVEEDRATDAAGRGAARAAGLLLAYRHGNQHAFDAGLAALDCDESSRDLVAALCWVATSAIDGGAVGGSGDVGGGGGAGSDGARGGGGDQLLRRLAAGAPHGERYVATDEEAAPQVAELIEAVARDDAATVRELVTATPDTTYVLGKLVQAVALLLPSVPRPYLRRVLAALREPGFRWSPAPDGIG
ncbi:hypothetical protein JJV70_13740 [Streptomyces sp. JJ66]|uniref:hypothetical protein n=1 Tax=Streptomyces sp. JJ66 TaxID=2803843 RepID=UPI001C575B96|nr:hypothetical protein [Streptomyces sp. JJ66]MBW1603147.1 hypothetical protein [Streptomyces sp. JJ66]